MILIPVPVRQNWEFAFPKHNEDLSIKASFAFDIDHCS